MTDTNGVHPLGHFVVHIGDEVGVTLLLQVEIIYIDTMIGQVSVELRLLWQRALVDLFGPEGMLAKVLPINTLDRVFL